MTENIEQNSDEQSEQSERSMKIHKNVKIGAIFFSIGTFLHMYFFKNDWSFITAFFSSSPVPWIMLVFLTSLVVISIGTYNYFRKYL